MKTALITGIAGQDGAYLASLLLSKGYRVVGARRHGSAGTPVRLARLGISDKVELVNFDMLEDASVRRLLDYTRPNEIYNLAAQSSIAYAQECPQYTAATNGLGVLRLLEAIRSYPELSASVRVFHASSSELFGTVTTLCQDETFPFNPRSTYGTSKLFAHYTARNYRENFGMHVSCGIMYNHTSSLQGSEFVARKITEGFRTATPIVLGNLDARRDWGYAADFVEAMWKMLQISKPDDYIIATNRTASVRELVERCAHTSGISLTWSGEGLSEIGVSRNTGRTVVSVDPRFYRPAESGLLCGDTTKVRAATGWTPQTSLPELLSLMLADVC